jgi:hypothetical protein
MLLAALALTPPLVLAEQSGAPQVENQPDPSPPGADEPSEPAPEADGSTEATPAPGENSPQVFSGMSILGNQETPTSLVIVPWKSSRIGESIGVSTLLDDSRQPVDKEVFMRALRFYQIRSDPAQ